MHKIIKDLEELINNLEPAQSSRPKAALAPIKKRIEEKELKLALIGNFSCGKSTFMNAMLKRSLLAIADMPTTAIPTYMDWNSPDKEIHIRLVDQSGRQHLLDKQGKAWLQEKTGHEIPKREGNLIDYLTTTNALQSVIRAVHISYPQEDGHTGFCVVDTPGVNPGSKEAAGHVIQTQLVLRQEADAAIILFPCYNVYTSAFREFLEENAGHLIDNSIFVITKMDQVPTEKERNKLIAFVKAHLQNDFGLEAPEVYGCSAGCALKTYEGRANLSAEEERWTREFEQMTERIFSSLEQRRFRIIRERTNSMMEALIHDLDESILIRKTELREIADSLEKYSFENLIREYQIELQNYRQESQEECARFLNKAEEDIKDLLNSAEYDLMNGVVNARGILGIQLFLKGPAKSIMTEYDQRLRALLHSEMKTMGDFYRVVYKDYVESIDSLLREYQMSVGSIRGVVNSPEKINLSAQNIPKVEIHPSEQLNMGWVVTLSYFSSSGFLGILLGLLVNALLPVDEKKRKICKEIETQVGRIRYDAVAQTAKMIREHHAVYQASASRLLDAYRAAYKIQFEEMLKKYAAYRRQVEAEIARMEEMLRRLQMIRTDFEMVKNSSQEKRILMIGMTWSGKSSLTNTLVGETVLRAGKLHVARYLTKIHYGNQGFTIYCADNPPYRLPLSSLEDFWDDLENGKNDHILWMNKSDIEAIEIDFPLNYLGNGRIQILNVPSELLRMPTIWNKVYKEYLPTANAVIYLMNVQYAFTRADCEILEDLTNAGVRNILIVFTRWDVIENHYTSDEKDKLKECLNNRAAHYGIKDIFYLSAKVAMEAKLTNDRSALKASGYLDLERTLQQRLFEYS